MPVLNAKLCLWSAPFKETFNKTERKRTPSRFANQLIVTKKPVFHPNQKTNLIKSVLPLLFASPYGKCLVRYDQERDVPSRCNRRTCRSLAGTRFSHPGSLSSCLPPPHLTRRFGALLVKPCSTGYCPVSLSRGCRSHIRALSAFCRPKPSLESRFSVYSLCHRFVFFMYALHAT